MVPKLVLILRSAIILYRPVALLCCIESLGLWLSLACIHRCLVYRDQIASKTFSRAHYWVHLIVVLLEIFLALRWRNR